MAITDCLGTANSEQFGYDSLYRLIDAQGHYGHICHSFNAVGNRQSRQINTPEEDNQVLDAYSYDSGSNRLQTNEIIAKISFWNEGVRLSI